MHWFKAIRAYWLAPVPKVVSFLLTPSLAPLMNSALTVGVFDVLCRAPLARSGFALLYGGRVTSRP